MSRNACCSGVICCAAAVATSSGAASSERQRLVHRVTCMGGAPRDRRSALRRMLPDIAMSWKGAFARCHPAQMQTQPTRAAGLPRRPPHCSPPAAPIESRSCATDGVTAPSQEERLRGGSMSKLAATSPRWGGAVLAAASLLAFAGALPAAEYKMTVSRERLINAQNEPQNWLMMNGDYRSEERR